MAHGTVIIKRTIGVKSDSGKVGGIGSRRIFAPQFKLQVLDSYRNDADCKGNQRATARKYGIHRRQIQKWLQVETNLRNSVEMKGKNNNNNINNNNNNNGVQQVSTTVADIVKKCVSDVALSNHRQQDDSQQNPVEYTQQPNCSEQRVPYIQTTSPVAYSHLSHTQQQQQIPVISTIISPTPSEVHQVPTSALATPPAHTYSAYSASDTQQALDCTTTQARHLSALTIDYGNERDQFTDEAYMYETHYVPTTTTPIDLSVKKTQCCTCSPLLYCPPLRPTATYSPYYLPDYVASLPPLPLPPPPPQPAVEYEIWDLSLKNKDNLKRKSYYDLDNSVLTSSCSPPPPAPPPLSHQLSIPQKKVKLFKPYLDDDDYCSSSSSSSDRIKLEYDNQYLNNNNETYKIGFDTTTTQYYQHSSPPPAEAEAAAVVVAGAAVSTTYCDYNNKASYSLNLKFSAIECFYNDEICRGNQGAVATKYNVHRKQVQKWLKEEHELRERHFNRTPQASTIDVKNEIAVS